MMGVFTFENEYTIAIPPAKLFKAFVLDTDNIIPEVVPHAIKSSQIIEGDGGPGTIRKLSFAEGMGYNYVIQKMEEVDKNSFSYNYSLIGGDALLDSVEKVSFENQFVASPDGGSICKRISKFYTKGDADISFTEEQIKETKKTEALFKAVEVYLLENPYQYA